MSTQRPSELVTQDIHAEDRLHNADVDVHQGGEGAIACLDHERFSVYVYARSDVEQGELHEALAAVFLQTILTTEWQGGDE